MAMTNCRAKQQTGATNGEELFLLKKVMKCIIGKIGCQLLTIPNYLKVGDEAGYWKTTLFQNGKLDLDFLAAQFSPRGYWCYVPQTIAKEIGERIGIDPSILWMLMLTFSWSILIMAFFPKLYQRTGRDLSAKKNRQNHRKMLGYS